LHKNYIHEEIKSRLNSGNAFYSAVKNLLSSRLLRINVKIKIYRTEILAVGLKSIQHMGEKKLNLPEEKL
jgi:hypothetical protein